MNDAKAYTVIIPNSVKSDLKSLDKKVQKKILEIIKQIAERTEEGEKLSSPLEALYKIKFSFAGIQYRIIYRIDELQMVICLILVGTRENFYLKLKQRLN